jgi:hypothetical protein
VSWTELMPGGPGTPPADPLRTIILGGLAYSALDLRERIAGDCADCGPELCPDHAEAAGLADGFEHAYMQVATGTREWCDLAVKLISEMN